MQFGLKKNHSINHCSFVIKEVVSYYLHNKSGVFACALGMQKAFYRVDLLNLSIAYKIMERIIANYLLSYLKFNNVISLEQHGFLECHSTETQLLEALDE